MWSKGDLVKGGVEGIEAIASRCPFGTIAFWRRLTDDKNYSKRVRRLKVYFNGSPTKVNFRPPAPQFWGENTFKVP